MKNLRFMSLKKQRLIPRCMYVSICVCVCVCGGGGAEGGWGGGVTGVIMVRVFESVFRNLHHSYT